MSFFYEDLVRIRKSRRLSKQDVFLKCRIPMEIIESIEDGSILSEAVLNKTYIRSYLRAYAKAVGVDGVDITTSLDEHEAGLYKQDLLTKYFPEEPEEGTLPQADAPSGGADTAEAPSTKKKSDPKRQDKTKSRKKAANEAGENLSRPQKSKIITPQNQEKSIHDIDWEDENTKKIRSTSTLAYYFSGKKAPETNPSPGSSRPPSPPDPGGIDWAAKVKKAVYRPQKNRLFWVLLAILLALFLAILSIFWFWQAGEPDPDDPTALESPAAADATPPSIDNTDPQPVPAPDDIEALEAPDPMPTDQADVPERTDPEAAVAAEPEATEQAPLPPPAPDRQEILTRLEAFAGIGDTLYIYAYAIHGNLEPIRVVSDIFAGDDFEGIAARPYWVEQRQAMRFDFIDEIALRGSLSRMVLLFNGHVIENFSSFYTDGSEIRVTRELLIENNTFDVAEGDSFSELDPPAMIVDRPRFSP